MTETPQHEHVTPEQAAQASAAAEQAAFAAEPVNPEAQAEIDAQAPPVLVGARIMLDSARPDMIPTTGEHMVAGYVDGSYEWAPADWDGFAGQTKVRITVEPFNNLRQPTGYSSGNFKAASVIDHESGAFSIADTARFVPARDDFRPGSATIYTDEADLDKVLRANRAHGRAYWLWLAWFLQRQPSDAEVKAIVARLAGTKATLAAWQHTRGPAYDTSAVYAARWHHHHTVKGQ